MTTPTPNHSRARAPRQNQHGFSLIEMIVTLSILATVIAVLSTVLIQATMTRLSSSNRFESLQTARSAADMMARDLRSAGFGVDAGNAVGAQPAIAYIDSLQVLVCENASPFPDSTSPGSPEAYNPAGSPRPFVLVGSQWTPPCKFSTGAEVIRYTLDLNDDGSVDASDVASSEGADARRSRCPDDYTLMRQVYGDRSGGTAGNNGGAPERVALLLKPGNGVPPLFTVFMAGSTTPWNWSNGPVPASMLGQVSRIEITVTAASGKADQRGNYSRTQIETAVRSLRNAPDFGGTVYTVDGYVYADANFDRIRGSGEQGLSGALVRLGSGRATYTSASGYYSFRVLAGNYALRHVAPAGYGSYSIPDSFMLSVAANASRSFADTSRTGGWITASVWSDLDSDGTWDAGEQALPGVGLAVANGASGITDAQGQCVLFAQAGSWSLRVTPVSGYTTTNPNPATGTISAGQSRTASFGMHQTTSTTVSGYVFTDTDGSGTMNGAEVGRNGVTVTSYIGTSTVYSTTATNASGAYSFSLPTPSAGSGTTYSIGSGTIAGLSASTTLLYSGIVLNGSTMTGYNFGFQSFASATFATILATELLGVDTWENDGSGATPNTKDDVDLLLAGTSSGNSYFDRVSNSWTSGGTPFSSVSEVQNLLSDIPHALLADTLRKGSSPRAPDYAVGSEASFSFEIWMRTSGTAPTTYTRRYQPSDGGRVNAIAALDCSGGTQLDLLVGTKSSAGRGTVEVWQSDDGTTPNYARQEVYPTVGNVPGASFGEANKLALADMDRDGDLDLVIATGTGTYSGQVVFMENIGRTNGNRFRYRNIITLSSDLPAGLAVRDIDGDGYPDVVLGTKTSGSAGRILVYGNTHAASAWTCSLLQSLSAPGAVNCLVAADLGGSSADDVAVGYSTNGVNGGVGIFYNAGGALLSASVDPSGGAVTKQVIGITTGNFNYSSSPATAGPYKADLAICYRHSNNTGYVVVYTR